ncbi:uncharacterized protein LOC142331724 [Lycorma delicatula]|uniref:uncharacterized protein LOC142331724 n=1 Tax=Lycorma delicatula TaxID=130591 RepID=UPI003F5151F0
MLTNNGPTTAPTTGAKAEPILLKAGLILRPPFSVAANNDGNVCGCSSSLRGCTGRSHKKTIYCIGYRDSTSGKFRHIFPFNISPHTKTTVSYECHLDFRRASFDIVQQ